MIGHTRDFFYTGSLQSYTIQTSGTYWIYAAGAQGGSVNSATPNPFTAQGGYGAAVEGWIHLTAGTVISVAVGGQGASTNIVLGSDTSGAGGGGGTFIYSSSGGVTTLLEVAGGGGGAAYDTDGGMGQASTSGQNGVGTSGGVGGLAGNGGSISSLNPWGGGGGAGWNTSGAGVSSADQGGGGLTFLNANSLDGGLASPFSNSSGAGSGHGGYGGGGGGGGDGVDLYGGGGGGGYSGGGAGSVSGSWDTASGGAGGGGGSYIINTAQNQILRAGGNMATADGYAWLNLISVDSTGGNTKTVAGINLSQSNVTNGTSLSSGNGASVTTTGSINAQGGSAQNNPLNAQQTSDVGAGVMSIKTGKILGLLSAISAEVAESMARAGGSAASSTDGAESMIAPPDAAKAVEPLAQVASDIPMQAHSYSVYGYNYIYLNDFQNSSSFSVTGQSNNPLTTNFLEIVNNPLTTTQTVDISGYQGIVLVNGGVNVIGLTDHNYLGALGGGTYTFGAGNQKLFLMGPNGSVVGGGGIDTVRFLGVGKDGANITQQGSDVSIWSDWLDTGSGVTFLHNVARAQFDDGSVAFDTAAGQNAGAVYRLYEAALHRAGDQQGIGYWINQLDNGVSLQTVANQFLTSQEFINLYGNNPGAAQYVNALYNNVLGRAADAAGAAYWQGQLQAGASKAQLLIQFAESVEGVSHVANQIAEGVQYQQWVQ